MTTPPDTLGLSKKATARGIAYVEQAFSPDPTTAEFKERQMLLAAACFMVAAGLMKVRVY